jgi:hypothetical protein
MAGCIQLAVCGSGIMIASFTKENRSMNLNWLRVTGLAGCAAFFLLIAPSTNAAIQGQQQGYYGQDRDWDSPQDNWNEVERRGFHDGIDGARKDYDNHRQPDVDNRDEYRRPNVPQHLWHEYREGFRRGYDVAMSHLVGGPDWRMRVSDRPWDAPPEAFDQIRRQGFQDGVEGARRDLDNHRQPNVENRDEYRSPNVPPQMWRQYREGFRHGYNAAISRLMSSQRWQAPRLWNAPPDDFDALRRQGFQDGIVGAQKDMNNNRRPDVNNRDEYRNPNLPPGQRDAYREGFRHGYQAAIRHMTDGNDHDRY